VPCSALNVAGQPDGAHISGLAHAGPELDRLLAGARNAGRVIEDITPVERFACAPIEAISAFARQSWESNPGTFALKLDHAEPVSGTRPGTIDVDTALPMIYVDLFPDDGSVHHLMRPFLSGTGNNPYPLRKAVAAPGPGLIAAIGLAKPLDLGTRPEVEKAAGYLAVLRPLLSNADTPPAVDLAMMTVRPAQPVVRLPHPPEPAVANLRPIEPPAPKPRPIEPAVARVPPSHPPALRSSRCSNIVSRAQLGETLSDAELTALRTECRS
jgi:hypothetical protein